MKTLVWFRKDLRIDDNPALWTAAQSGGPILAVYIDDREDPKPMGAAAKWFAQQALIRLQTKLATFHIPLLYYKGSPLEILQKLCDEHAIQQVVWNRLYTKYERTRDETIKSSLKSQQLHVQSFNGYLLFEPWCIATLKGTHFQVFTPFWKQCLQSPEPDRPLGKTPLKKQDFLLQPPQVSLAPATWENKLGEHWVFEEDKVYHHWQDFLQHGLTSYAQNRDIPAINLGTSRMSAYLHHGLISIHRLWHYTLKASCSEQDRSKFLSELGWREFSYHLLYHFPDLSWKNFNSRFDNFPWTTNENHFTKWCQGETGIPIVDAGMKQLWETGWMHNRVRMIVASFLTKHLLIDWRSGEAWFWDTLVDADPASNAASWQWVAGCGADAAPYFRIFNPVLQSRKFDPQGTYIRTYLPQLKHLDAERIHEAWLHDSSMAPLIDLQVGRARALQAYETKSSPQTL